MRNNEIAEIDRRIELKRQYRKEYDKEYSKRNRRKPRVEIPCEHCGSPNFNKRFCNAQCQGADYREKHGGNRNPGKYKPVRVCKAEHQRRDTLESWSRYLINNPGYAEGLLRGRTMDKVSDSMTLGIKKAPQILLKKMKGL